jgi:hypothetical protein
VAQLSCFWRLESRVSELGVLLICSQSDQTLFIVD